MGKGYNKKGRSLAGAALRIKRRQGQGFLGTTAVAGALVLGGLTAVAAGE